ncbi:MAG: hypothetical protein WCE52_15280 [Candidatus Acidiferrum sp.]
MCPHWKYQQVHQVGSHIILEIEVPKHQRIAIPAHPTLKIGTLGSILRAITTHKGVSREAILKPLL